MFDEAKARDLLSRMLDLLTDFEAWMKSDGALRPSDFAAMEAIRGDYADLFPPPTED